MKSDVDARIALDNILARQTREGKFLLAPQKEMTMLSAAREKAPQEGPLCGLRSDTILAENENLNHTRE